MARGLVEAGIVRAGWTPHAVDGTYRPPEAGGVEVSHPPADAVGLPGCVLLCMSWRPAGRPITIAVGLDTDHHWGREVDADWIVDQALGAPRLIAMGAVTPWLNRMRRQTPVWVRAGDGPWWPLGGGSGRNKVAGPGPDIEPLTIAVLDSLAVDVSDEVRARADRVLFTLRTAGWKDARMRAVDRQPGMRVLWSVTVQGVGGAKARCDYVLTGEVDLPEALWLRFEDFRVNRKDDVLVDVLGAADRGLLRGDGPGRDADGGVGDRVGEVLDVLERLTVRVVSPDAPAPSANSLVSFALPAVTTVYRRPKWKPARTVAFGCDWHKALPGEEAPEVYQAVAAARENPGEAARWRAAGLAAGREGLRHAAVVALRRAVALRPEDGLARLWLGAMEGFHRPGAALDELERAAEAGTVTGPARWFQGHLLRWAMDEPERARAAYTRATVDDPAFAPAWVTLAEVLRDDGRIEESLNVLAQGLAHHEVDGELQRALCHAYQRRMRERLEERDRDAALAVAERLIRLMPKAINEVFHDSTLWALRADDRFQALVALVEPLEVDRNRRARRALRPPVVPPVPTGDRVATLAEAFAALRIGGEPWCRTIPVEELPPDITEPTLRPLLSRVGLPNDVNLGNFVRYSPSVLTPITHHSNLVSPPAGIAGLHEFGNVPGEDPAGAYLSVAFDGATGEVFTVDTTYGVVRYAAPSLDAFFLAVIPDAVRDWRLDATTIDRLDRTDGLRDGSIRLCVTGPGHSPDPDDYRRFWDPMVAFVRTRGHLLRGLELRNERPLFKVDLGAVDLGAACPSLETLSIQRTVVNESVFAHPRLVSLRIRQSYYRGAVRDLRLTAKSPLEVLEFVDSLIHADSLVAEPGCALRTFETWLDEDYAEAFPERLEFADCPNLYKILVCGTLNWHLILRGSLPKLGIVEQDPNPYGAYDFSVEDATPEDKKRYLSLIRKGKNFKKRW